MEQFFFALYFCILLCTTYSENVRFIDNGFNDFYELLLAKFIIVDHSSCIIKNKIIGFVFVSQV